MKDLLKNNKILALSIFWFFIHLMLLITRNQYVSQSKQNELWPFTSLSYKDSYDFTEFVFYVLGLYVCIIIITLLKHDKNEI